MAVIAERSVPDFLIQLLHAREELTAFNSLRIGQGLCHLIKRTGNVSRAPLFNTGNLAACVPR